MDSASDIYPDVFTERLHLRVFDPSRAGDYDAILAIYTSKYSRSFVGDVGINTRDDIERRCKTMLPYPSISADGRKKLPSHPYHLAYHLKTHELVGMTSLFQRPGLATADIGYATVEAYAGQGYATEAARASLRWWTEQMGVQGIWAGTSDSNEASQAVARKIGLVDGGVFRVLLPGGVEKVGHAFVQPGAASLDGVILDIRR